MKQELANSQPRLGSLCTGYGGLDMAAIAVFGGKLTWCADNDKHVSVILAALYPDAPNLGDLTALDWTDIPTVDILCAGFPCQDISFSGRGAGIEKRVRSGIWRNIVTGIRIIRPKLIIVENVSAIRSRGLARVLGDLANNGYDSIWTSLRASDVGAAHRRERVFILAHRPEAADILAAAHTRSKRWGWRTSREQTEGRWASGRSVGPSDLAMASAVEQPQLSHGEASSVGQIAWGRYEVAIRRWEALTKVHERRMAA